MKLRTSFLLSLAAIAGAIIFVTACDSPGRLASKIEGTWSGMPQRITTDQPGEATYMPMYTFERDNSRPEGRIVLAAEVSVMLPVDAPVDSLGAAPISATANAQATVSGIWTATDDDEIKIAFDPTTLVITMNPELTYSVADVFTSTDTDESVKPSAAVMRAFSEQIRRDMNTVIAAHYELDDIEFRSDNMLTCELQKRHITLSRVTE